MAEVDFYKLERPVQDRFADATRAIGVPVPILRTPPLERRHLAWFVGAAGAVIAVALLTARGFGDPESAWAIAPSWHLGVLTTLVGVAVLCLLRGLAVRYALTNRPYRPGLYLFPVGVVDARREPLRVHRLPDIAQVQADAAGSVTVTTADGSRHTFHTTEDLSGEKVVAAIEEARALHDKAVRSHNRREQALLDPLVDSGFSSPFSPKLPIVRRVPPWQKLTPAIAVVVGVAVSVGTWTVRNRLSERVLYDKATRANTVSAYQTYLERGGNRSDVENVLLPRAELRHAREANTVEAIEQYQKDHPSSKIQSEVTAALHEALDTELERVKKGETISALRTYAEKRKDYQYVQKPVRDAIQERYRRSVERFLKVTNRDNPEVASFVERLVAYSRDHSPKSVIRWVRVKSESLKTIDSQIRLSAYFMGNQSVPSQYFGDKYAAEREKKVSQELLARFESVFSDEVLDFEIGAPVNDLEEEGLPDARVPTLFIKVVPNLAGGYMSSKPRGVFVGVGMMFEATFVIPGEEEPLKFKSSSWRTPNISVYREEGATIADVYEDMARTGYERFTDLFIRYLFKDDPAKVTGKP